MSRPHPKPVQSVDALMPHPALPAADWGDAFVIETTAATARAALEQMLLRAQGWPTHLLALRNRLGAIVGLKAATFSIGGQSGFPVVSETPDEIILGFDDSHLDFRIIVTLSHDEVSHLRVATLVKRHGMAGRAYIGLIAPAHRRIIRHLMSGAARARSAPAGSPTTDAAA